MFIIYTIKSRFGKDLGPDFKDFVKTNAWKAWFVLPFLLLSFTSPEEKKFKAETIAFNIINKDSKVGHVVIQKQSSSNTTIYSVDSEVNARVIFSFNAISTEKSIYRADTLVYSKIHRRINRKVKLDQCLTLNKGRYIVKCKKKQEVLSMELISRNLVTLFFSEPKGIQKVYSDKFKKMVKIAPVGQSRYKVVLPNNSILIYNYKDNKCTMMEAKGTFYKVKLIPVK